MFTSMNPLTSIARKARKGAPSRPGSSLKLLEHPNLVGSPGRAPDITLHPADQNHPVQHYLVPEMLQPKIYKIKGLIDLAVDNLHRKINP